MDIDVLGIDLGKTFCSLSGLDETGSVVFRKRLQRHSLLGLLEDLRPCFGDGSLRRRASYRSFLRLT